MVLDGLRSFQVVSRFSKDIDVLIKNVAGAYPGNPMGRGGLGK